MQMIEDKASGTKALRKVRCSISRQVYSITSVCINREKVFAAYKNARLAAQALNSKMLWPDAKCLAWVVMPDHMHVLVELGGEELLSLVVQRIKSLIAAAINRERNRRQPVWQRGYYDHAIERKKMCSWLQDISSTTPFVPDLPKTLVIIHIGRLPMNGSMAVGASFRRDIFGVIRRA